MVTSAYMSPEQACGKPVDHRTDIWAFGCLLFETLTRRRTFAGDSMTEVLAAVLERPPDWEALPASLPWNVRSLLRRCLTKDRQNRLQNIGDARLELEETLSGAVTVGVTTMTRPRPYWPAATLACLLVGPFKATTGNPGSSRLPNSTRPHPSSHPMASGSPTVPTKPAATRSLSSPGRGRPGRSSSPPRAAQIRSGTAWGTRSSIVTVTR
jgi:serine/threonine protein kinase